MHHYPFHVGDYAKNTAHLSPTEDLILRRLFDVYYDTEQPIPNETQWVSRRIRFPFDNIEPMLKEFFELRQNGWNNDRCNAVIAQYLSNSEKNRRNGKLGGRPKKTHWEPTGKPNETQTKPKRNPTITNNQVNPPTPQGGFDEFWKSYPKKVGKGAAEKAWSNAKINGHFLEVMSSLEDQKQSIQWGKDGGQFIPNPATWINQRRWEDSLPKDGKAIEQTPSLFRGVV